MKATNSGTVALFAPHKRGNIGVEGLVEEAIYQLANRHHNPLLAYSPDNFIKDLSSYFSIVFGENYLLTKAIRLGFLFHHADFPQGIREIIEDALRSGYIRFVICTNTLAEGVNLPIKTIVIHSTRRYNPDVIGRYESIKIRDLKNLVGRAGRAGKETKGLVIIPNSNDFGMIERLIKETYVEPVKGQLYNIINLITNALKSQRLVLSSEMLDSLDEDFQKLLDSIDVAMIDLLAEEVNTDDLQDLVKDLITHTLSYYQANTDEKETLNKLFELRSEKIKPIIESGNFKVLKYSGTDFRLYKEIISHFDFENEIWYSPFDPLNEDWLNYIFDEGLFKLERYKSDLIAFNQQNVCELDDTSIKKAILLWMDGNWFEFISDQLNIEIHKTLRLINGLISFNIQSIISTIIRIKELTSSDYNFPQHLDSFPSLVQNGINSILQLALIDLGLIDRIAVLHLGHYLEEKEYHYCPV